MDRRIFNRAGLLAGFSAFLTGPARADEKTNDKNTHRVAIQVSAAEHKVQELALGNAHNFAAHFKAKSEPFKIEIVAFGPGFGMMRGDISMVKGNIEALQKELGEKIAFSACENTRAAIAAGMGQRPEQVPLMPGVVSTPSGIARLAELQEQGWSYIRP